MSVEPKRKIASITTLCKPCKRFGTHELYQRGKVRSVRCNGCKRERVIARLDAASPVSFDQVAAEFECER